MISSPADSNRIPRLTLTGLGFTTLVTQVLMVREFLHVSAGNEVVLGLVLASWLLLTGLGSLLAQRRGDAADPVVPALAQAALGLLPLVQIVALRVLKSRLPAGLTPDLGTVLGWALVVLAPFCLISGFLLARLAGRLRTTSESGAVAQAYALDCLGSLAGGLLLAFALTGTLAPVQTAALLLTLNAAIAALALGAAGRRPSAGLVLALLVAVLAGLRLTDVETRTLSALYPGQDLVFARSTRHGQLAATLHGRELTVYADGVPVNSSGDRRPAEEAAHWALAQIEGPSQVLVIGGEPGGVLDEVARHRVDRVDFAETNPAAIDLLQQLYPGGLASVTVHREDGRRLVERAAEGDGPHAWDAVLVVLPPPSTVQLNRYYTVEFFRAVRRALRPGGVVGLAVAGAENYASGAARATAASVVGALDQVFTHHLVIPGDPLRLLAGDRPLTLDISPRLRARGVSTLHLRPEYLASRLSADRQAEARRWVMGDGTGPPPHVNGDLQPTALRSQIRHDLERSGSRGLWPAVLLTAVTIAAGVIVLGRPDRALSAAVATSGVTGLGLELVLLLGFQVTVGGLYHHVALLAAAFLAGGAAGAWLSTRCLSPARNLLLRLDAVLALLGWGLAFLLLALDLVPASLPEGVFALLFATYAAVAGAAVGGQLPAAAQLTAGDAQTRSGGLFGLDLVGGCAGALGVGIFAVPLWGLPTTCCLLGGLKTASALCLWLAPHRTAAAVQTVPVGRVAAAAVAMTAAGAAAVAMVAEGARSPLYALTFAPWYTGVVVAVMAAVIADAVGAFGALGRAVTGGALSRGRHLLRGATEVTALRWAAFFGLGLLVFYPICRCFFAVPWLFCHVCPRPCVFGYLRPYLVPAALLANLERRHWCRGGCPLGTLHQCQAGLARPARRLRRPFTWLAPVSLGLTAVAYLRVQSDAQALNAAAGADPVPGGDALGSEVFGNWYQALFLDGFAVVPAVLAVAAALLILGFRWLRPFCDLLCPVGTLSEWILRLERRWLTRAGAEETGRVA